MKKRSILVLPRCETKENQKPVVLPTTAVTTTPSHVTFIPQDPIRPVDNLEPLKGRMSEAFNGGAPLCAAERQAVRKACNLGPQRFDAAGLNPPKPKPLYGPK